MSMNILYYNLSLVEIRHIIIQVTLLLLLLLFFQIIGSLH